MGLSLTVEMYFYIQDLIELYIYFEIIYFPNVHSKFPEQNYNNTILILLCHLYCVYLLVLF